MTKSTANHSLHHIMRLMSSEYYLPDQYILFPDYVSG
jgi:hypothetical protein